MRDVLRDWLGWLYSEWKHGDRLDKVCVGVFSVCVSLALVLFVVAIVGAAVSVYFM